MSPHGPRPRCNGPRFAILALLIAALPALVAADFSARVAGVIDGDTITVLPAREGDRAPVRIRLSGIDAPERRQAFGTQSKQYLSGLVFDRSVDVDSLGRDRNGRTIARIHVDSRDVNLEMVAAGLAWHYRRYSQDEMLTAAEHEARTARRGLWRDPAPIPPWEFRQSRNGAH